MIALKIIKNMIYLVNEGEEPEFLGADPEIYINGK